MANLFDKLSELWNRGFQRMEPAGSRRDEDRGAARTAPGAVRTPAASSRDRAPVRSWPATHAPPADHAHAVAESLAKWVEQGTLPPSVPCWCVLAEYDHVCAKAGLLPLKEAQFLEAFAQIYSRRRIMALDAPDKAGNQKRRKITCYDVAAGQATAARKKRKSKAAPRPSPGGSARARPPRLGPAANLYVLRPGQRDEAEAAVGAAA